MDNEQPNNVAEIVRVAQEAIQPTPFSAGGYRDMLIVKEGMEVRDINEFLSKPERIRRRLEVNDLLSLFRYWDKWNSPSAEIYADLDRTQVRAVFDEHTTNGDAEWLDHCAIYDCPKGKEWAAWCERDGTPMSQEEFGMFLEDRAQDVLEPSGADLIALAAHFSVSQDVSYTKAVRQQDGGVSLGYSQENHTGGSVEVPKELKLVLAPFHNGEKYEVRARFRYRLNSGNLKIWYELIEPWRIVEDAFTEVCGQVETHTSRDVLMVKINTLV